MTERVICTVSAGVADVRLNRADKLNAIDWAMFAALDEVTQSLRSMHGLRAVVLSGAGRAFSAGFDTSLLHSIAAEGSPAADDSPGNPFVVAPGRELPLGQYVCWVWREIPVPVIAAVHGATIGGGLQMALFADIRYAATDLKAGLPEINWGIVPDLGGTFTLNQLMRGDQALELALTGRWVGAEEAERLGLVTKVTATPYEDAHELAAVIAAKNPQAVRALKHLMTGASSRSGVEQLREEHHVTHLLNGSPNQREAAAAMRERRAPVFRDS